jgi:hypothetical protein
MKTNNFTIPKFTLGSNKYKRRYKGLSNTRLITLGIAGIVFMIAVSNITATTFHGSADAPTKLTLLNPLSQKVYAQDMTPTPTLSEHDQIKAYIQDVFGQDAPKAFQLLSCENAAYRADAVNDNTQWGGIGQDIGVFQVNTVWQGVSNKAFLYDWRINVDIAHNIYTRDGHSFKLWTCGKKMNI